MFCFLNLLLLVPALYVTTDHEAVEGVGDDVDAGGGGKHHGPGREGTSEQRTEKYVAA